MSLIEKAASLISGRREPVGTIHVVDPSALNWLYITYNTVEELIRVSPQGSVEPAAMSKYSWVDDHTLEVELRENEQFPTGDSLTSATVKRGFEEMMRWRAPHPPGTAFNLHPQTRCEILDERRLRFHLPETDGLAIGKLRAMHLMSTPFWTELGFGYKRHGTGEGHW